MGTEFGSIVSGYCADGVPVWEQEPDYRFFLRFRMSAIGQPFHQYHICASFSKCDYGTFTVLSYNGVHLLVTKRVP